MAIKYYKRKLVVHVGERTFVFPRTRRGLIAFARFVAQNAV